MEYKCSYTRRNLYFIESSWKPSMYSLQPSTRLSFLLQFSQTISQQSHYSHRHPHQPPPTPAHACIITPISLAVLPAHCYCRTFLQTSTAGVTCILLQGLQGKVAIHPYPAWPTCTQVLARKRSCPAVSSRLASASSRRLWESIICNHLTDYFAICPNMFRWIQNS